MDQAQLNWITNFIWGIHLYGQEINAETYAICKADLLLKGDGDAGQGESNIRRWVIEKDWLEAIVALPLNMFYNTGIATYVWVLTNRKAEHRKGKIQLIDATQWFRPLRKNMGKKNCELATEDIKRICDTFLAFEETPQSKIFPNAAFGYWKVKVERPLRLHSQLTRQRIETLRYASGDEAIARTEREIALMQEYRTRLTADLVTGKLDVREAAAKLPAVRSDGSDPSDESDFYEETTLEEES